MIRAVSLCILIAAAPAAGQTRLLVGVTGGIGGGFPARTDQCSGGDNAQIAAITGLRMGRLALFSDVGMVLGGGACAVQISQPIVRADTVFENSSYGFPVYPVSLNARFDVARFGSTAIALRSGGGWLLRPDVPFFNAGLSARVAGNKPSVGAELLYTRFSYDRERVITDPPNPGEMRSIAASRVAQPLAVRILVEW
jgi:hypothetical protein